MHENPAHFDIDGERDVFRNGLDALEEVAGVRPRGYRSPSVDFSPNTIDVLLEHEIGYDSSCSASDFIPYYLRRATAGPTMPRTCSENSVDIVEVPFYWGLSDFAHFEFVTGFTVAQNTASSVLEIWQGEFDYAYEHCTGGNVQPRPPPAVDRPGPSASDAGTTHRPHGRERRRRLRAHGRVRRTLAHREPAHRVARDAPGPCSRWSSVRTRPWHPLGAMGSGTGPESRTDDLRGGL